MNDLLLAAAPAVGALSAIAPEHAAVIVTFQIGQQLYGLPLEVVREIVRLPALITLPGAPPTLCGLLNLRGQYVPILDGYALVGEPSHYDLNNQIVIAGRDTPELGLLVDQVSDVWTIATSQIAAISQLDVPAFLSSAVDRAGRSVLLFDLAALLTLRPAKAKRKAKRAPTRRDRQTKNREPISNA